MNKKQLLQYLAESTYCKLAPSSIHGVGVFAIRDIPKGVNPFKGSFENDYIAYKKEELDALPPEIKSMVYEYCIPDGDTFELPTCGLNGIDISFFMNHSRKPNMVSTDGYDTFVTTREIKKGEELTFLYPNDKKKIMPQTALIRKRKSK